MENEKKKINWKAHLITGGITFVIGVGIFLLAFFLNHKGLVGANNGAIIAAVCLLGIGGLMWVASFGFFDIFAYGFKQFGATLFSKKPGQYNDFPGYREDKRISREKSPKLYLTILIVGAIFLVLSIVLFVIYKSV